MKPTPMSRGLSKRKSAPAVLLRLSSLPEPVEDFQLIRNHTRYQRNSQSEPSLAAPTNESFSTQESLREYTVCEKENHNATICDDSGSMVDPPTNRSPTNLTEKAASVIISNDIQQKAVNTSLFYTGAGPLRELVPA